jgi:protein-disulfide isomerase
MTTRRAFLTAAAGGTTVGLAGCTSILGGDDGGGGGGDPVSADGPVASAPLPDGESTYARMGTGGPVVTYYGNWKCPFCAEFSTGSDRVYSLGDLVGDYVEPGDLTLEHRSVAYLGDDPFLGPDAPRAARAGLSVWNRDPETYWHYHENLMANQPPEGEQWATADRLVEFANAVEMGQPGGLRDDLDSGAYEQEVRANTDPFLNAFGDERAGTPAVVVDGTPRSPFEPEAFRNALDSLVE